MSSEEKRAVVTLNKGVDASQFLDNMTTTFGSDAIPSRSVTLHNEKVDSVSNFDFVLFTCSLHSQYHHSHLFNRLEKV